MNRMSRFTSESMTEGHPDKLADQISDEILDNIIALDPEAHVAIEAMVGNGLGVVMGEVRSTGRGTGEVLGSVDVDRIVRGTFTRVGYDESSLGFDPSSFEIRTAIHAQSPDIAQGVEGPEMGAGDQGMMFGFACTETHDEMPMPIWLSHRFAERLSAVRRSGVVPGLFPDGKIQVTVCYEGFVPTHLETVVISAQHDRGVDIEGELRPALIENVIAPVIPPALDADGMRVLVNPTGRFEKGGPKADTGLTGRKIIADSYGGMARHGGGAFSGKDPSKVDRSAAYVMRCIAKHVVTAGAATRCEIQVAYAIGRAEPVSLTLETFGTHVIDPEKIMSTLTEMFDLRPAAIIRDLDLQRPVYLPTATYGHFGRSDKDFTWEQTPRVDELRAALGL